jgi:deoxyribodipyrimidine photo-lyase
MFRDRVKCYFDYEREEFSPKYVVYWMQQSQRYEYNHALNFSIQKANKYNIPVLVYFVLDESFKGANERSYMFMLEGLVEVRQKLEEAGIGFIMVRESFENAFSPEFFKKCIVVMDKGYLSYQGKLRQDMSQKFRQMEVLACYEIESDVFVPVEIVSSKEEYMARTIRPKIWKLLYDYIEPMENFLPNRSFFDPKGLKERIKINSLVQNYELNRSFLDEFLLNPKIDHSVKKSTLYQG